MLLMHETRTPTPLYRFAMQQADWRHVCSGASCGSARKGGTGAGCRRASPGGRPAQQPCAGGVASCRGPAPGMPTGACVQPCQHGCSTRCTSTACTVQRYAPQCHVLGLSRKSYIPWNMAARLYIRNTLQLYVHQSAAQNPMGTAVRAAYCRYLRCKPSACQSPSLLAHSTDNVPPDIGGAEEHSHAPPAQQRVWRMEAARGG